MTYILCFKNIITIFKAIIYVKYMLHIILHIIYIIYYFTTYVIYVGKELQFVQLIDFISCTQKLQLNANALLSQKQKDPSSVGRKIDLAT